MRFSPRTLLWAGLLPSLDCEPPFPLSLGSLLNGALDATSRWPGSHALLAGPGPSHPQSQVWTLGGCWVDPPELTAPWFTQGEAERDNSRYLFPPEGRTVPMMVILCPSWRPPWIIPVKGTTCGEEMVVSVSCFLLSTLEKACIQPSADIKRF